MTVRAALTGLYNSTRFTPFFVEVVGDVEVVVDEDLDRREGVIAMVGGIGIVVLLLLMSSFFVVIVVLSDVDATALFSEDAALAPPLRNGEGDSGTTVLLLMMLSNAIDVGRSGNLCRVGIIILFCAQDVLIFQINDEYEYFRIDATYRTPQQSRRSSMAAARGGSRFAATTTKQKKQQPPSYVATSFNNTHCKTTTNAAKAANKNSKMKRAEEKAKNKKGGLHPQHDRFEFN